MRVLVAEDNSDAAQILGIMLRAWGFEPELVHEGRSALESLREPDAPTLALLDWNMPGLDGIDVCRAIRQECDRPYTYVILVTGRGGREQMIDGLKAGADDYLVKPVDPNELQARLNTARRILDLQAQLLATQHLLREQATRDALTGLWNRAMILEILQRELARSKREHHPVAVLMADIDHFKQINDTYGHLAGDTVLRQIGQRLLTALRPYDTVGRYGGEEFMIVLPGCGSEAAEASAERLREFVAAERIVDHNREIGVTLSLGLSVWDGHMHAQELLRATDGALYASKRAGRNRVTSVKFPAQEAG